MQSKHTNKMNESRKMKMKTPFGDLYMVAGPKGLQGLFWEDEDVLLVKSSDEKIFEILEETKKQLNEYFKKERKTFNLKLDPIGTEFQKQVWRELQRIPYGQTRSYKEIAEKIQNPKATRAVGSANGANPLCIIIPCHRVITSGGKLGGYSGGLDFKIKLLTLEDGPSF